MLPRNVTVQSGYENVSILHGKQQALLSGVPLAMYKIVQFLLYADLCVEMTLFPQGREDSFPMIDKFNKNHSLLKSLY